MPELDLDPPHGLWEGRVVEAEGARYLISIPGRLSGEEVTTDEKLIHPIPMTWTRECRFCLA